MATTLSAYSDKIKEVSMLSLICSCFYTQPHITSLYQRGDVEEESRVTPPRPQQPQRASGQAFQVYLQDPSAVAPPRAVPRLQAPPQGELSLGELQGRLEAAEQRRKSHKAQVLKQLAEKREREWQVLHRAHEENNNFSRKAEEKLHHKMEANREKREARLHALKQRLLQKEVHAAEVRRNKELQAHLSG